MSFYLSLHLLVSVYFIHIVYNLVFYAQSTSILYILKWLPYIYIYICIYTYTHYHHYACGPNQPDRLTETRSWYNHCAWGLVGTEQLAPITAVIHKIRGIISEPTHR